MTRGTYLCQFTISIEEIHCLVVCVLSVSFCNKNKNLLMQISGRKWSIWGQY